VVIAAVFAVAVPLSASARGGMSGRAGVFGGPGFGGPGQSGDLAAALGITADQLAQAQQKAWAAGLAQAVKDGLITQKQADALKTRGGGLGHLGMFGLVDTSTIDSDALLAEALGITKDKLVAAREKAADDALATAVKDGRMTQAQADQVRAMRSLQKYMDAQGVQSKAKGVYESALKDAVKAGVITQAQADEILANGAFGLGGTGGCGMGGGFGGRGGHGMRGGFEGGNRFGRGQMDGTAPSDDVQNGGTSGSGNGTSTRTQRSGTGA